MASALWLLSVLNCLLFRMFALSRTRDDGGLRRKKGGSSVTEGNKGVGSIMVVPFASEILLLCQNQNLSRAFIFRIAFEVLISFSKVLRLTEKFASQGTY